MSGVSTPSRRLSSTTVASDAAQPAKSLLMQFGPGLRTGAEHQQADRLAAVAQGQHEQARAPVLAAVRVADHRASAVIDLGLFAGRGLDHGAGLRRLASDAAWGRNAGRSDSRRRNRRRPPDPARWPWRCGHGRGRVRSRPGGVRRRLPRGCGRAAVQQFIGYAPADSAPESVITSLAGFAGLGRRWPRQAVCPRESVITSLAGFAGGCRPQPPGGRKAMPGGLQIGGRRFAANTGVPSGFAAATIPTAPRL